MVCRYPGTRRAAVDGVSFEVAPGELVVLLGPSGCGKTTLLKTVNRLVEPSGGRVLLEGADVRDQVATDLRRRIGYVIQATGLFPHLTVERNVAVVPELLGWDAARRSARVEELLALVNLPSDYRARYPRQLSGGEAQRVGLARALAADPAYLLMDEPFGAIDAINRAALQAALGAIQSALRKTILFVTHDVDEALRLADRVAVLRAGRVVQYAPPLALLLEPADAFVRDLVGADDVFRRLGLLKVGAAMASTITDEAGVDEMGAEADAPGSRAPPIRADADIRTALIQLLGSGAAALPVADADGRVVGRLTLDDVRRLVRGEAGGG